MMGMILYTVQSGDSLYAIARRFGMNVQEIIDLNGLGDLPYLIVGQTLIIPATQSTYRVNRGDTVYAIADRFGVPMQSIIEANALTPPYRIYPGNTLRIPIETKNYGTIEVNGYIEPTVPDLDATMREAGPYLTYISPFSYTVNSDGTLNPLEDQAILDAAGRYAVAPLMVVTNFVNGNFQTPVAILTSKSVQRTLIDNIQRIIRQKGYYGLNIDFERIDPEYREEFIDFLREVVAVFRPQNIPVSVALAPKTSDVTTGVWYGAHDYAAIGNLVDFVILMTYEWGWSGGPPFAVSPINPVEDVVRYAVSVMPANKILMGMTLYGYDWTLPYVEGGPWARRVSPQEALLRAANVGAQIQFDSETQSPYFNYYDAQGRQHVVWFEDARSARQKLLLVNQYGLRGISFWVLGLAFPQIWQVLDRMFRIVKVV